LDIIKCLVRQEGKELWEKEKLKANISDKRSKKAA
jgi:hypothetical protein